MLAELEPHADEIEQAGRVRWSSDWSKETAEILHRAQQCGIFKMSSMTQFGLTESGRAWVAKVKQAQPVTA